MINGELQRGVHYVLISQFSQRGGEGPTASGTDLFPQDKYLTTPISNDPQFSSQLTHAFVEPVGSCCLTQAAVTPP